MILSIESSCDDSSIALTSIDTAKLIYHKKISQELEHSEFGGVVPELASRLHAKALPALLEGAKDYLGSFESLKAVAITNEPGLSVTLNEGVIMAKSVATFLDLPVIPVNHLKGHIYSLFIDKKSYFPLLVILVSGGHTMIIRARSIDNMEILATSLDDSVGEAYDKVAKMLGLGYPGGPIVEKLAKNGNSKRFNFPVPLRNSPLVAFSLSGLKNAVRLEIEKLGGKDALSQKDICDICASFQDTIVAHLSQKLKKILKKEPIKDVALVGGVSANLYIRESLSKLLKEFDKRLSVAPLEFCADNAAMVGRYGVDALGKGLVVEPKNLKVSPTKRLKIGEKL
jgi:N6-L-threonylcarbamoyladenine synthase